MGTVGDALDNAVAESFFATLECELLDRHHWPDRQTLRTAIFDFIEVFYNPWGAQSRTWPLSCQSARPSHGTVTPLLTRLGGYLRAVEARLPDALPFDPAARPAGPR
jgi:hypothetical protein